MILAKFFSTGSSHRPGRLGISTTMVISIRTQTNQYVFLNGISLEFWFLVNPRLIIMTHNNFLAYLLGNICHIELNTTTVSAE